MIVDFPETSPWKLLTKIEEHVEQNFEDEEATSFSRALFSCETPSNDSNPSRKALMRIWMQIPFEGSEFEPPATRAFASESRASPECGIRAKSSSTPLGHWVTSYGGPLRPSGNAMPCFILPSCLQANMRRVVDGNRSRDTGGSTR